MVRAADKLRPSRAMLPGEFLCAGFALALAMAGGAIWPLQPGLLYAILQKGGDVVPWVAGLGTPSLLLMFLSVREWVTGKNWACPQLGRSCRWRGRCVAGMCVGWIYGIYLLGQNVDYMNAIFIQCFFGIIFCSWSYWENRRVQREIRKHGGLVGAAA